MIDEQYANLATIIGVDYSSTYSEVVLECKAGPWGDPGISALGACNLDSSFNKLLPMGRN